MSEHVHQNAHTPVMLNEVIQAFSTIPCEGKDVSGAHSFIDATFGRGGHTRGLLEHFPESTVLAIDQDPEAIAWGKKELLPEFGDRLTLCHARFSAIEHVVRGTGGHQPSRSRSPSTGHATSHSHSDSDFHSHSHSHSHRNTFSGIVFDLGVSSPQLDDPERGFSLKADGPLDMRMGNHESHLPSAADIVNHCGEKELADIFFRYGQERKSRQIASHLVDQRVRTPFTSTLQLAQAVARIVGYSPKRKVPGGRSGRSIHPATRVFQALRIAVNRELEEIQEALPQAARLLRQGGCLAVISFHSLEDGLVKDFFRKHQLPRSKVSKYLRSPMLDAPQQTQDSSLALRASCESSLACPLFEAVRKPLQPSQNEISANPRARSARLRFGHRCLPCSDSFAHPAYSHPNPRRPL